MKLEIVLKNTHEHGELKRRTVNVKSIGIFWHGNMCVITTDGRTLRIRSDHKNILYCFVTGEKNA